MDKRNESKMLVPYYPTKEQLKPLILGKNLDIDRSIIDNLDTNIIILDRDMNITLMNRAAEKTLGILFSELKGKNFLSLKSQSIKNELSSDLDQVIKNQKTVNRREIRYLSPDNAAHFIDFNYMPIINEEGQVEGILSFGKDVTEAVNQEIIQQETNNRLQDLLKQLSKKDIQIKKLQNQLQDRYSFHNLIGKNHLMQNIFDLIERIAPTDSTVLITGETGVGKELVAKAIHYNSNRKDYPLISINCASIVETLMESELFGHVKGSFTGAIRDKKGKFELAHKGTIFLDEIGEISLSTQAKLLRVIQEKEIERIGDERKINVDIRIIAATNQDLLEMITMGKFRKDLYYRLNVISVKIPPLRDRLDDLPLLAKHFIALLCRRYKKNVKEIPPSVLKKLLGYSWPGNVRELESVLEKAVILSSESDSLEIDVPGLDHSSDIYLLPGNFESTDALMSYDEVREQINEYEKNYFLKVFKQFKGRINDISQFTGLNRRTILNKINKFDINKSNFR
ncbi:MAG: sigma-54 interaction domain-containing protein [bacterium]